MVELPKPLIGIIGGSGLYKLHLEVLRELDVQTEIPGWPFGPTSSPVSFALLPTGQCVAFIARHGVGHHITPSEVPGLANIAALKHVGCAAILAFSAVGSLREDIRPRDIIVPNHIIDRTKGIRPSSYFGNGIVAHCMFGEPFDNQLTNLVVPLIEKAIAKHQIGDVKIHTEKTVVCMEGPQFSTKAESKLYRSWGGDIINMSVLPEAKLAREAELSYTLVCTATDYDAWHEGKPVTVPEVMATLAANAEASNAITKEILGDLHNSIASGTSLTQAKGAMQYSIVTKKEFWPIERKRTLSYILPYFRD